MRKVEGCAKNTNLTAKPKNTYVSCVIVNMYACSRGSQQFQLFNGRHIYLL